MPTQTQIIPYIFYRDVPAALDWLAKTFGFKEEMRTGTPKGSPVCVRSNPFVSVRKLLRRPEAVCTKPLNHLGKPQRFENGHKLRKNGHKRDALGMFRCAN